MKRTNIINRYSEKVQGIFRAMARAKMEYLKSAKLDMSVELPSQGTLVLKETYESLRRLFEEERTKEED